MWGIEPQPRQFQSYKYPLCYFTIEAINPEFLRIPMHATRQSVADTTPAICYLWRC